MTDKELRELKLEIAHETERLLRGPVIHTLIHDMDLRDSDPDRIIAAFIKPLETR
jgi:hypothetical protein